MSDAVISVASLAEANPRTERPKDPNAEVSFVPMADVSESGRWTGRQTRRYRDIQAGYTAFRDGDVLFAKITPCMENGKGALVTGLASGIGFGSTEFHVLRAIPGKCEPEFLAQVLTLPLLRQRAETFFTGSAGQRRVPERFFEHFFIPKYTPEEQRRIAELLSAVDEQIALLEADAAKRKAILSGLIDALLLSGHRAKTLADFCEVGPKTNVSNAHGLVPFVSMDSVSEAGHLVHREYRNWPAVSKGFTRFAGSDVLVAKITPCFENGKGFHAPEDAPLWAGSTEFHVLRAKEGVSSRWLFWHTRSREFLAKGAMQMTGSAGQQRVPRRFIEEFPVVDDGFSIQEKKAALLDAVSAELQGIEAQVQKSKKKKQGLLSALLQPMCGTNAVSKQEAIRENRN